MITHTVLRQLFVLGVWATVVTIRIDGDTSARSKDPCYFDVFRIHQLNQVFHDDVYAVLMKITVITEAEKIEFQALALYHLNIRQVADTYLGKVGLSGDGTKAGKLGTVETHPIVVSGVFGYKRLQ